MSERICICGHTEGDHHIDHLDDSTECSDEFCDCIAFEEDPDPQEPEE